MEWLHQPHYFYEKLQLNRKRKRVLYINYDYTLFSAIKALLIVTATDVT